MFIFFGCNHPVLDPLNKLNDTWKTTSVLFHDFSTLFAKIPRNILLKVFNELIGFCFKGEDGKFISVDGHMIKWAKERRPGFAVFTRSNLKKAVKRLPRNCYFELGNRAFRKIIVITVALDPAPFLANLFLHYYESR